MKTILLFLLLSACATTASDPVVTADALMKSGKCSQAEDSYHQAALQPNITLLQRASYYNSAALAAICAGDHVASARFSSLANAYTLENANKAK